MRLYLLLYALISGSMSFAAPHKLTKVYNDTFGQRHTRWVITEPQGEGRTLLLVVDQTDGSLQQVLRREWLPFQVTVARALEALDSPAPLPAPPPIVRTGNPLWPLDHSWTDADEIDYGKWLGKIAAPDFLAGSGLTVDCADYAMTLRWIYAHDHHLPAADSLVGSGEVVGSWESTAAWDKLPTPPERRQDQRFKAALLWVLDNSFTHTLLDDLYPVLIDPAFVAAGTIYLTLSGNSGHTRTIFAVGANSCTSEQNCIAVLWGNEPASESGWISELFPNAVAKGEGGFMRFRWPELTPAGWKLRDGKAMRGYAEEQYTWDDSNYLNNIAGRLGLWGSPEERYTIVGEGIVRLIRDRVTTVELGYFQCSVIACKTNGGLYANWSTPVRDQTLLHALANFHGVAQQVDPSSNEVRLFQTNHATAVFRGAPFTFVDLMNSSPNLNGDPTADLVARWGVTTLSELDHLRVLAQAVSDNWTWRLTQVAQAQLICYPHQEVTPLCDPNSAQIKALNSDRLDRAFRQVQLNFLKIWHAQSVATQAQLALELDAVPMGVKGCRGEPKAFCTLLDYLVTFPALFSTMSANAADSASKRFGF